MKIGWYVLLTGILFIATGCTYTGRQINAELRSLEVVPTYFCSGQGALFSFHGSLVDSVQVNKSDGTLLLKMLRPLNIQRDWSGQGETLPMKSGWLPLGVVYHSNTYNKDYPFPFPPEKFVNIDQEKWTGAYKDTIELAGEPYLELTATMQEYDSASDSGIINVPIYDVKRDFNGFQWEIPDEFSSRATLVKIQNLGQRTMIFTISGVTGEYRLAPNMQSEVIPNFKHPAGKISARYEPSDSRLVGKQKGEYTKPLNEQYSYTDLYTPKVSPIRLLVRCRDE